MKLPHRCAIALIFVVAVFEAWGAAAADAPKSLAGADRYIQKVQADWGNVGAAVAVVQGDEVIYARGFGLREKGKSAPVTADTLFQIGSTSKAFTTAALGILVDEGKIRWDDPVTKYLPDFELQDPWLTRHLTIRDVVTHRSGIPDSYYAYLSRMDRDAVIRQMRYLTPEAEFRDSFRYNNLMYAAAGKIIEVASGMSWHEFVRTRVLQPLAMTRSGTSAYQYWDERYVAPVFFGTAAAGLTSFDQARDNNVAMPHGLDESGAVGVRPWLAFENAAPAGSIVSNAADMGNWLIAHLNDGRFADRQLLQKGTMRELHTAQSGGVGRALFPLEDLRVAMGWFAGSYQGHSTVFHSGGIIGFPAYIAMMPEQKIGVVVLANGPTEIGDDYKFHRSIVFWLFDRLLNAPVRDWNKEFRAQLLDVQQRAHSAADKLREARLPNSLPSLPLEKYAGDYRDRSMPGNASVLVENGRLILRFAGEGAFAGYLEHWHGNLFRLHSSAPGHNTLELGFVEFGVDAAAKVTSMSVSSAYFKLTLDAVERH